MNLVNDRRSTTAAALCDFAAPSRSAASRLASRGSNRVFVATCVATGVALALSSYESHAQGSAGLEEIVVTATRRAGTVQDIPLAVTALSGNMLETQNIENVQDLTAAVPNVVIYGTNQGSGAAAINFRGIPNVGVYVDDVWQVAGAGLLQRQFVDLDRIEVLRGPQGTLNGRDSTGGSIHVYTRLPGDEYGGVVNLGVGDFERRDVSASLDLPLSENFKSKWALARYEKDGYIHSINTGQNFGALESEVWRADLLWTPTDKFSARLIHSEDEQVSTTARVQIVIDHTIPQRLFGWQIGLAEAFHIASLAAGGPGFDGRSTVSGFPGGRVGEFETTAVQGSPTTVNNEQTSLHLNYDISDNLSVKYVYGDFYGDNQRYVDYAGSEFNFFAEIDLDDTNLESHEIQISGSGERVNWNAGYYTWDQTFRQRIVEWSNTDWTFTQPFGDNGDLRNLDYADVLASAACTTRRPSDVGLTFPGDVFPGLPCNGAGGLGAPGIFAINRNSTNGLDGSDVGRASTQEGQAIFGEVTFDLTEKWDMTFGARWHDQDNKSYRTTVQESKNAGTTELRPVLLDTLFNDVGFALASPFDSNPATQDIASFDQTTVRFATTYDFRDGLMGYIGYSEGFNSGNVGRYTEDANTYDGVFYPALDIIFSYDPEIIENWEIGIRGDFFSQRLRANLTYFQTDWKDIQLATSVFHTRAPSHPALTETSTQNAADGFAEGVEAEITFAATDALTIGANLGWLDSGFSAVLAGSGRTLSTEFGGAPEETYNLFGAYAWDLAGGASLDARLETNYTGRFWRSANPNYRPEAYGFTSDFDAGDTWKVNARVSFTPASANYQLSIWGNNLTDEFILNSGFIDNIWGFDFAGVDAPREVGLSIRMTF